MKIIIDIREPYEYRIGHIPNAINIPYDLLDLVPDKYLDKNKHYILYCNMGILSLKLSNKLKKMGYNVESLKEGYTEYIDDN